MSLSGKVVVKAVGLPEDDWDEPRFQRWVVATARANGWRVRVTDQRGRTGWRGQVMDKGWPDLILVKDRLMWFELKTVGARQLRPEQADVIAALHRAGAEIYIFTPADWETLVALL